MYHFDYVSKKEAAPYKAGLIELLNKVQDYVRDEFTLPRRWTTKRPAVLRFYMI